MNPQRLSYLRQPTRPARWRRWVLCMCLGIFPACEGASPLPEVMVEDSAGIQITTYTSSSWDTGAGWRLDDSPLLSVGVVSGPKEYQFSDIVAVWQTDGEMLIVGERMGSQIRMYDPDGRFVRAFGAVGTGPGEFRHFTALVPYRGDSIVAWDAGLSRLSVFDGNGALGRTQRISIGGTQGGEGSQGWGLSISLWGTFPDGSLAFSPPMFLRYELPELPIFRLPVVRMSAEGDSLGVLRAPVVIDLGGTGVPFPRLGTIAVHGTKIYSGLGERFELEVSAADGKLEGIIRLVGYSRPVSEADRQTYTESYRARLLLQGKTEEQVKQELATVRFPTTFPPYSALLVDAEHHLWVEEYRKWESSGTVRWQVFDPSGRRLGRVGTPNDLVVHQVGTDFVLGVRALNGGVPVIEKYRLIRTR